MLSALVPSDPGAILKQRIWILWAEKFRGFWNLVKVLSAQDTCLFDIIDRQAQVGLEYFMRIELSTRKTS